MVETTQEASRTLKCPRKLYLSAMVGIPFFCMAASLTALVLSFVLFCTNCPLSPYSTLVYIYWAASVLLFLLGAFLLGSLACNFKKRQNRVSTSRISSIPEEDLEKSPAFVLPHNQVLQHQPVAQHSSTDFTVLDLPDYLTAVQNIDGVYSSPNEEVWTENVPETPPPCYEKALEMTALVATANEANACSSEQAVFTQEMDK